MSQTMDDLLIMQVGDRLIGLKKESVRAVGRVHALTAIPTPSALIGGVVVFNNQLEAAIDLRAVLNGKTSEFTPPLMGVAIEADGVRGVILVGELVAISAEETVGVGARRESDRNFAFITGEFQLKDKVGYIINPEELLRFIKSHQKL
jgi:chemotaxis signal transduction protein